MIAKLQKMLNEKFADVMTSCRCIHQQITIEVPAENLLAVCKLLRDEEHFQFECLMDVCGVDYANYGIADWQTETATATGFDRGVEQNDDRGKNMWNKPRFAVVYHLLSIKHNHRLRVRCFAEGETPKVDSVISVWQSANWFERETFDLFGIIFEGHPDLRRILTDYGFVGHPMRKDFPVSGHVEVRYDHEKGRVVYQPVSIEPRTLVPRVIREASNG